MILYLVVKCFTLIVVIHLLRLFARRAGPRVSGMLLGLPSSSAILLVLCAREQGAPSAVEMADASLLGLAGAVVIPMAYAGAVRRGWRLPSAMAASVAAYLLVAATIGLIHPDEPAHRLAIGFGSIFAATLLATRIGDPVDEATRPSPSRTCAAILRTSIPIAYVTVVGLVSGLASPWWAGLVSAFPSMTTVVLAVTHLEEGPETASRIARAVPPANLSTAAFLAAFRIVAPSMGLAGGVACGYLASFLNLAAVEAIRRSIRLRERGFGIVPDADPGLSDWTGLDASRIVRLRTADRHPARLRSPHRRHFAPRLEILTC